MPAVLAPESQNTFSYCHACGEQVLTYPVRSGEGVERRCSTCGLPLGRQLSQVEAPLECVMLAEDDEALRLGLSSLLLKQQLAGDVVACDSGAAFLAKFVQRLRRNEETRLVILDIRMQNLDGVAAARALRALELGFGVERPVPILFLSGLRPDAALLNFVARVRPALFLNKGVDSTPGGLAARLRKTIESLTGVRNGPAESAAPA